MKRKAQLYFSEAPMSILPTSFSRRRSWPPDFPSPQSRPARQFRPSSADALSFGRCFFACIVLKKGYQCWTYDATRKSLIITTLGIFRVGIFATLKMAKQLSHSDLQVTLHVSRSATRLSQRGLTALGTRGRGPRSGRAWSSRGLLVAARTQAIAVQQYQ